MTYFVLVTDGVDERGLQRLIESAEFDVTIVDDSSSPEFAQALDRAQGLVVRSATMVDAAMIDAAPALKVIGRAGVGVDNIDVEAASQRGIAVFNAPSGNTVAAAELTMALILAMVRRLVEADDSVRVGKWDRSRFQGVELEGRTLGLIGAGRVGGEVALRAQSFGMDVIVYDPYLTEARGDELGFRLTDLDVVLENSDIISVHVPLTTETEGLVGEEALSKMKADGYLVNAARGGVIDEAALARALIAGTIAGAALDVYQTEPLPDDSPLRQAPNLIMTPHIGASTRDAQVRVAAEIAERIEQALTRAEVSAALNAPDLT
jgi:D-3-phosphoglycerate dehydrogenase